MPQADWSAATGVAIQVLHALQGVAPLNAFVAAGLTAYQVAALFRLGVLVRPRKGWYLDPELPWQARIAVRVGGIATCVSSAPSWGLPVPPDAHPMTHVSLEQNASRLRDGRNAKRRVRAGEDHRTKSHWEARHDDVHGWRTGIVDTLLHLGDCVPLEWFVAALDAALHQPRDGMPLLSQAQFAQFAALLPIRLHHALALVDPLSESPLETLLRLGMTRRGIGPLVLQFSPTTNQFVDFLLPGKVIVEADGVLWHDPEKDAIRDARFRKLGYGMLRFSYDRIVFDLETVLDEIEEALTR